MTKDDPKTLVSTEWLAKHLSDPDLRVLDGSWYLPGVDRDPKSEYQFGHIPGARNIHFRDIPDRLEAIGELAENADTIVVYCERGGRATKAEKALIAAGFSNVIQLTGHMKAWRNAAFPIEKVPESAL